MSALHKGKIHFPIKNMFLKKKKKKKTDEPTFRTCD